MKLAGAIVKIVGVAVLGAVLTGVGWVGVSGARYAWEHPLFSRNPPVPALMDRIQAIRSLIPQKNMTDQLAWSLAKASGETPDEVVKIFDALAGHEELASSNSR